MESDGRKPTILDVARRAGVSVGTVSNVLNESSKVRDARREAVLSAIAELGFLPNSLAQSLRRQRSRVVGLCVPHTTSGYFAELIDAFENIASHLGYEVMQVLSRHDGGTEQRRIRALLAHRIAGLILIPSVDPRPSFELVARSGVPAVVVDRPWDDPRFDYVTIDNRAAMAAATTALLERGHRRLLYIVSYPALVTTRTRIEAFQAVAASHRDIAAQVMEQGDDRARFTQAIAAILAGPAAPTAIIASNSGIALWLMRALRLLDIRCPDRVSVLAFDEPAWAEVTSPPLAVLHLPTAEIARIAWQLLVRRIEEGTLPPQRVELQARLQLGESIGAPP